MKSLFYMLCRLSCCLIIVLAVACKKENLNDGNNEALYTLNLQLANFTAERQPFGIASSAIHKLASTSGQQQDADGHLFYWSFNQESLQPDLSVPSAEPTKITYNDGLTPSNFVNSTYSYGGYVGGKALSISGGQELVIEVPLRFVQKLSSFGFDIGSTSTGPKDFSISYSWDGITYEMLQEVNQFSTSANNAKNSFTYDLQSLALTGERFWVKLEMKAGNRMDGSDYNPSSGAFRMDNIHIKGGYQLDASASISKLHYFIYHKDKPDIFVVGEVDEADWGGFDVQLPMGSYDILLVSNQSGMELNKPATLDEWSTLFVSNYFMNAQAEIFGLVDEIEVTKNESFTFTLERLFSQVKFEFTDTDLSLVDKLVITPLHEPFYFNPSGALTVNPVLDQTEISFSDVNTKKQVLFHQFLGILDVAQSISYQLDVYTGDEIIHTLTVASNIKNNNQIVFRGELLSGVPIQHGFSVNKNEVWGEGLEESF